MGKLMVIGSLNMDMTLYLDETPRRGETVYGRDFLLSPGGKGANQAVAAARLGAQVAMLGRVGDDLFGHSQIEGLARDGIDVRAVTRTQGVSTGVACIQVVQGDNSIALAPGANERVRPGDIDAQREAIAACDAVMLQFELPMDTVAHAVRLAKALGKRVFLTPAPVADFDPDLLGGLDVLVPNEHEARRVTGFDIDSLPDAKRALAALADKGVLHPMITLGSRGVLYWDGSQAVHAPARKVQAVDTTAAGDTFAGGLAAALLSGQGLAEAVEFAQCAAALCVTRKGAQCAIPTRTEVLAAL